MCKPYDRTQWTHCVFLRTHPHVLLVKFFHLQSKRLSAYLMPCFILYWQSSKRCIRCLQLVELYLLLIHCMNCIHLCFMYAAERNEVNFTNNVFCSDIWELQSVYINPLWKHVWWKSTTTRSMLTLASKLMASGRYLQQLGHLKTAV